MDRERRRHRRQFSKVVAWTSCRILVISTLIVVLLAPVGTTVQFVDADYLAIALALIVWGIAFALVFRWQLHRIEKASHPMAAMTEALMVVFMLFLAIFAKTYHLISMADSSAFTEPLDYFNGYYYGMTVFSTVGFGDITPVATFPRALTMVQMLLDLVLIGVAVRVITTKAKSATGQSVDN